MLGSSHRRLFLGINPNFWILAGKSHQIQGFVMGCEIILMDESLPHAHSDGKSDFSSSLTSRKIRKKIGNIFFSLQGREFQGRIPGGGAPGQLRGLGMLCSGKTEWEENSALASAIIFFLQRENFGIVLGTWGLGKFGVFFSSSRRKCGKFPCGNLGSSCMIQEG